MKNSCSMWHKWEPIPQKEPSLYTLLKSNVFLRERVGIVFENQRFKDGKISRPFQMRKIAVNLKKKKFAPTTIL